MIFENYFYFNKFMFEIELLNFFIILEPTGFHSRLISEGIMILYLFCFTVLEYRSSVRRGACYEEKEF